MQVDFDITLDDIHAFNRHYAANARLPRRARQAVRFTLTFVLGVLFASLAFGIQAPLLFWLLGLLILGAFWTLYPTRVDQLMRRQTELLYAEGHNRGLLGPHTVALEPDWLVERSTDREIRTRWPAVESVHRSAEHLFLYVSGFSAVIVPLRAFESPERALEFELNALKLKANCHTDKSH